MGKHHTAGIHLTGWVLVLLPHRWQWPWGVKKSRGHPCPEPHPECPSGCSLSPTRAGQQRWLLQQELLCGKEGLLGHEQRVVWLGQGLRRWEARLRRHGWCGLRGGQLWGAGVVAGTRTCGRLQALEASFMALRMLPEEGERPEVSGAPAGREAPRERPPLPSPLDSSQAALGLWVSRSPG